MRDRPGIGRPHEARVVPGRGARYDERGRATLLARCAARTRHRPHLLGGSHNVSNAQSWNPVPKAVYPHDGMTWNDVPKEMLERRDVTSPIIAKHHEWGLRAERSARVAHDMPSVDLRRIGTAGTPATVSPGGTERVTTAPAATTALSPMHTPGRMITPAPMKAPRQMRTSPTMCRCESCAITMIRDDIVTPGSTVISSGTSWSNRQSRPTYEPLMCTPIHRRKRTR